MSEAARLQHAMTLHQRGDLAEAAALYRGVLRKQPANPMAAYGLGMVCADRGEFDEAARLLHRVAGLRPDDPAVRGNYANVLKLAGRREAALAEYDALLARHPGHAGAWSNRAATLNELGRHTDALASIERALAIAPEDAAMRHNHGNILADLGRDAAALEAYDRATALDGGTAERWLCHAQALVRLRRYEASLMDYHRVLELEPERFEAWRGLAAALIDLGRFRTGLEACRRALALSPDDADVHWFASGACLVLGEVRAAMSHCERAQAGRPDIDYATGQRLHAARVLCEWAELDRLTAEVVSGIDAGRRIILPMESQMAGLDASRQLACARLYAEDPNSGASAAVLRSAGLAGPAASAGCRIRVGYVSGDFRNHPVGQQMRAVVAHHDRAAVEAIGISLRGDDGDPQHAHFKSTMERFVDVSAMPDEEAVRAIAALGLDIAVDLQGHTSGRRMQLFAAGLAPVQVNFLCPGTSGAAFIDYIIADRTVLPDRHLDAFSEKAVRLPGSFFINDYAMLPAAEPGSVSRALEGLPEDAFVFASFCDSYKLSPEDWDGWMGLLRALPRSVLWLGLAKRPEAVANLQKRAAAAGVGPERLVIARFAQARHAHVARLALADLCLDTPTYNGHTTTADALWAGTPVLTVAGAGFSSRVAASILTAAGLEDLVLPDLASYLARARALAEAPAALATLRGRVAQARTASPFFDAARAVRHLEAAYRAMVERAARGLPPALIDIAEP